MDVLFLGLFYEKQTKVEDEKKTKESISMREMLMI